MGAEAVSREITEEVENRMEAMDHQKMARSCVEKVAENRLTPEQENIIKGTAEAIPDEYFEYPWQPYEKGPVSDKSKTEMADAYLSAALDLVERGEGEEGSILANAVREKLSDTSEGSIFEAFMLYVGELANSGEYDAGSLEEKVATILSTARKYKYFSQQMNTEKKSGVGMADGNRGSLIFSEGDLLAQMGANVGGLIEQRVKNEIIPGDKINYREVSRNIVEQAKLTASSSAYEVVYN